MRTFIATLALAAAVAAQADYSFLVTETPSGSNSGPYTNGVRRYNVDSAGVATAGIGIAAGLLDDPAGLALSSSGELFVGNREGNGVHPGMGSVSRFLYDSGSGTYVPNGSIMSGSTGTHGVNFSPTTGELFAANVDGPVTRFVGTTANGSLNSGAARDVLLSGDGKYAYVTQGVNGSVLKFDVATGAFLNSYSVAGGSGLHFGSWLGDHLYIGDYGSSKVFDLAFDANGDIVSANSIASVAQAISVGFSPDGREMYVPGHTTGDISKFVLTGGSWIADGTIHTGVNMGDIQVVPEPATLAVLSLGILAMKRRRR